MLAIDPLHRCKRAWRVAEGERIDHVERLAQSTERVRTVAAVLGDGRGDERVRHLEHQRPRAAAEQHGDLAVNLPGDAAGPEEAVLRRRWWRVDRGQYASSPLARSAAPPHANGSV